VKICVICGQNIPRFSFASRPRFLILFFIARQAGEGLSAGTSPAAKHIVFFSVSSVVELPGFGI
jgi:hypothetical protein